MKRWLTGAALLALGLAVFDSARSQAEQQGTLTTFDK